MQEPNNDPNTQIQPEDLSTSLQKYGLAMGNMALTVPAEYGDIELPPKSETTTKIPITTPNLNPTTTTESLATTTLPTTTRSSTISPSTTTRPDNV